jgi:hypothetical protein
MLLSPTIHKFGNEFIHSGLSVKWAIVPIQSLKVRDRICESKNLANKWIADL